MKKYKLPTKNTDQCIIKPGKNHKKHKVSALNLKQTIKIQTNQHSMLSDVIIGSKRASSQVKHKKRNKVKQTHIKLYAPEQPKTTKNLTSVRVTQHCAKSRTKRPLNRPESRLAQKQLQTSVYEPRKHKTRHGFHQQTSRKRAGLQLRR